MTALRRKTGRAAALGLSLCVWFVGLNQALAATFEVAPGSEVRFTAKITASSFVAKSNALSGTVDFDAAKGFIKSATIQVKANSFVTGMSMRDSHMRDKYLEAEKFPDIVFQAENITVSATPPKEGVEIAGVWIIKGVKKPMKINVQLGERSDSKVVLQGTFKLDITEFGIPQPKFAIVKMETVLDVTLNLVLTLKP